MPLQYIQDLTGTTTAVIVPIEEWNKITEKFSGLEELPQWQKDMIDSRLELYKNNPADVANWDTVAAQFDKEDETV